MKPSLIACCLVPLGAIACGGAAEIPDTPDLSMLRAAYENPTASLDQTSAGMAVSSSSGLKELAAAFEAAKDVIGDDVDDASSSSSGESESRLRVQGSISLHVLCPGDLAAPKYDENVNGSLSFTLALADNRIRRSFGGVAKGCILHRDVAGVPARIRFDGQIAFDVGGDIGLGKRWSGELLALLPGELQVGETVFRSISGRRTASGQFQHLVNIGTDTVVLELGDQGITIRDRSGAWLCLSGESCARL